MRSASGKLLGKNTIAHGSMSFAHVVRRRESPTLHTVARIMRVQKPR
jgi:hypothetical protein